jgi:hypothetical protein
MPRRPAITHAIPAVQLIPLSDGDSDNNTEDQADQDQPPILISLVKARAPKQGIVNKSNIEVWDLLDIEIIGEQSFF